MVDISDFEVLGSNIDVYLLFCREVEELILPLTGVYACLTLKKEETRMVKGKGKRGSLLQRMECKSIVLERKCKEGEK